MRTVAPPAGAGPLRFTVSVPDCAPVSDSSVCVNGTTCDPAGAVSVPPGAGSLSGGGTGASGEPRLTSSVQTVDHGPAESASFVARTRHQYRRSVVSEIVCRVAVIPRSQIRFAFANVELVSTWIS
jgi:hypothetical protein